MPKIGKFISLPEPLNTSCELHPVVFPTGVCVCRNQVFHPNPITQMSSLVKFRKGLEEVVEYSIFASRWMQALIYCGLIFGAGLYTYKFIQELATFGLAIEEYTEVQAMLAVLGLIDISMVMNLLIIVIIGGYSIFTSRLDFEGTEDKPQWLDNLDADRLKVKLSTSLASISGVHLLKTFVDVHSEVKTDGLKALNFEIAIHMVFIFSSLMLAWIVRILAHDVHGTLTEKIEKGNRSLDEILDLVKSGKTATRSHIKNLIQIAAADGNFEGEEQRLLETIAKINNIPLQHVQQIRSDKSKVIFEVPEDPVKRFFQLFDLVRMMSADSKIHPSEMRLCELFAIKFGYQKEIIKDLIELIRANIEKGNSAADTLRIAQPMFRL
jgi:uncharacterized protein (TIGR00645 family)